MLNLNDREWRPFFLTELFPQIQRGKRLKTENHIPGKTPYVSSSALNNGVDNFISNTEKVRIFSDCIRACLETHLSIMKRFNSMLAMAI